MSKKRTGTFLGLPYDWRRPSLWRLRDEMFNRDETKLFVPKSYGWGYGINLAAPIARRRRRRRGRRSSWASDAAGAAEGSDPRRRAPPVRGGTGAE